MYHFIWLSSVLRADHSKPLSCFLHLPLILIISCLPKMWPERFPRAAKGSSQVWERSGQGLAVLETSLHLAEKTGPFVAAGASGSAQMPGGNCLSRMTGPGPPSLEGWWRAGEWPWWHCLTSAVVMGFVQRPDCRLEPCSLNQAQPGEPAAGRTLHLNWLTSVAGRGNWIRDWEHPVTQPQDFPLCLSLHLTPTPDLASGPNSGPRLHGSWVWPTAQSRATQLSGWEQKRDTSLLLPRFPLAPGNMVNLEGPGFSGGWWSDFSFQIYLESSIALDSEKAMAPHSSTVAWKIPWMEEPGRLQSMGLPGARHDWATSLSLFTSIHWRRKWQPTPVFLPGESQGWGSLVGCRLWGCTESDPTEAT